MSATLVPMVEVHDLLGHGSYTLLDRKVTQNKSKFLMTPCICFQQKKQDNCLEIDGVADVHGEQNKGRAEGKGRECSNGIRPNLTVKALDAFWERDAAHTPETLERMSAHACPAKTVHLPAPSPPPPTIVPS